MVPMVTIVPMGPMGPMTPQVPQGEAGLTLFLDQVKVDIETEDQQECTQCEHKSTKKDNLQRHMLRNINAILKYVKIPKTVKKKNVHKNLKHNK